MDTTDPYTDAQRKILDGRYRLIERIGGGGFGAVWRARTVSDDALIAVKILTDQTDDARRRFRNEAEALRRLEHPSCVRFLDAGIDGTQGAYLVMEFVDGVELLDWLRKHRSVPELLRLGVDIAQALEHAHRHGILHRDLKPANIMIVGSGGRERAKVVDFGIAKLVGAPEVDVTKTGEVFGTPGYMSPEQLRAQALSPATDVYALGAVLFEMLEGRPPFEADSSLGVALAHLTQPIPQITAGVSDSVRRLLQDMLAKEPARRPGLVQVIRVLSPAKSPEKKQVSTDDRVGLPALVGVIAALVIAGAAVVLVWRTPGPPPRPAQRAPVTAVEPPALVQRIVHEPLLDASADDGAVGTQTGCGHEPLPIGVKVEVRDSAMLSGESVWARLPPGYDPNVPAPVLVAFHDTLQNPRDLLGLKALKDNAAQRGFVMITPRYGPPTEAWYPDQVAGVARTQFAAARRSLCLDGNEIFVVGVGHGAIGADRFACRTTGVAGVVLTSFRLWGDHLECELGEPLPTLVVSPTQDPFTPVDGVQPCFGARPVPLDEQERRLRERHACSPKPSGVRSTFAGCEDWECAAPLTLCRADGGRFWARMTGGAALGTQFVCPKPPPTTFDYESTVWTFIDRTRAARRGEN